MVRRLASVTASLLSIAVCCVQYAGLEWCKNAFGAVHAACVLNPSFGWDIMFGVSGKYSGMCLSTCCREQCVTCCCLLTTRQFVISYKKAYEFAEHTLCITLVTSLCSIAGYCRLSDNCIQACGWLCKVTNALSVTQGRKMALVHTAPRPFPHQHLHSCAPRGHKHQACLAACAGTVGAAGQSNETIKALHAVGSSIAMLTTQHLVSARVFGAELRLKLRQLAGLA